MKDNTDDRGPRIVVIEPDAEHFDAVSLLARRIQRGETWWGSSGQVNEPDLVGPDKRAFVMPALEVGTALHRVIEERNTTTRSTMNPVAAFLLMSDAMANAPSGRTVGAFDVPPAAPRPPTLGGEPERRHPSRGPSPAVLEAIDKARTKRDARNAKRLAARDAGGFGP